MPLINICSHLKTIEITKVPHSILFSWKYTWTENLVIMISPLGKKILNLRLGNTWQHMSSNNAPRWCSPGNSKIANNSYIIEPRIYHNMRLMVQIMVPVIVESSKFMVSYVTLEILWEFLESGRPLWMTSPGDQSQRDLEDNLSTFAVSTVPAGGLGPFGGYLQTRWWRISVPVYLYSAPQVPWNSMELLVSSKLAYSRFHGIPRNSMELLVSAKLAHLKFHGIPWNCSYHRNWRTTNSSEFHGTVCVSEIGALQVPWNSTEFHGTAGVSEIGAPQFPRNSMELLVSAKLAHS